MDEKNSACFIYVDWIINCIHVYGCIIANVSFARWNIKLVMRKEFMKMLKNQRGFTLIEMMIVLLVISVLLIITVPNVTKNNSTINEKGSEAYIKMVEGQIQAYEMENKEIPTVRSTCRWRIFSSSSESPAGKTIQISTDGVVTLVDLP